MSYSANQWVFFFFIYCFLGWLWETAYVSVRTRKWVNRGFMHGPFLPIYGSGAVVILLSTLGVRDNLLLIYIFGMIGSTILEYCTGAAMQRLFGVRYWDYSKNRFNLNGHICLFVSLAWGFFSILLVRILHPPVEEVVLAIPEEAVNVMTMVLIVVTAVDMTISTGEALDLKAMLIKKAESNEELRKLAGRIDFVYALAEDDLRRFKEEQEQKAENFRQRLETNLQEARRRHMAKLDAIGEEAARYFAGTEDENRQLEEYLARLEEQRIQLSRRTDREYLRLSRILRRNPGAVSRDFRKELEELRDLTAK